MDKGLVVSIENSSAGNRAKVAECSNLQRAFPILSLYIYLESFEPGKGSKPVKVATRIGKVSKRYRSGEDNQERAYLNAIERAAEIACDMVYQLKQKRERFSRVFISQFKGPEKAKQDPGSFDYFVS